MRAGIGIPVRWFGTLVDIPEPSFVQVAGLQLDD